MAVWPGASASTVQGPFMKGAVHPYLRGHSQRGLAPPVIPANFQCLETTGDATLVSTLVIGRPPGSHWPRFWSSWNWTCHCASLGLGCCSVAKSCLTLCDPKDCSTPGFPVLHHLPVCADSCPLSQWCRPTISSSVIPFSSCLQSFPACVCMLVAQSCPTLCDPMDCSLPGCFVHGILQARILEWVAISFSSINIRIFSNESALRIRWPKDWSFSFSPSWRMYKMETGTITIPHITVLTGLLWADICEALRTAPFTEWARMAISRGTRGLLSPGNGACLLASLLGPSLWKSRSELSA